jgi:hypothetical protein
MQSNFDDHPSVRGQFLVSSTKCHKLGTDPFYVCV